MKKKIIILLALLLTNSICVSAKHLYPEKFYQKEWCNRYNGVMEYRLKDGTRVDVVTKNYAVEFDFAPKWAEAIGQSLYYAKKTGKKPAIILIIEKPTDFRYYKRAEFLAKEYKIKLWYMTPPKNKTNYNQFKNNINKLIAIYLR